MSCLAHQHDAAIGEERGAGKSNRYSRLDLDPVRPAIAAAIRIAAEPEYQQRAVSVHVYQQPMSQCEIYSLETGTYQVIQLAYTSEYGKLNPSA